jgi:hypothetical protein
VLGVERRRRRVRFEHRAAQHLLEQRRAQRARERLVDRQPLGAVARELGREAARVLAERGDGAAAAHVQLRARHALRVGVAHRAAGDELRRPVPVAPRREAVQPAHERSQRVLVAAAAPALGAGLGHVERAARVVRLVARRAPLQLGQHRFRAAVLGQRRGQRAQLRDGRLDVGREAAGAAAGRARERGRRTQLRDLAVHLQEALSNAVDALVHGREPLSDDPGEVPRVETGANGPGRAQRCIRASGFPQGGQPGRRAER